MMIVLALLGLVVAGVVLTGYLVSIDFALRITEASPGFWDWLNPDNIFAWIVMFLALSFAIVVARAAIALIAALTAFVFGMIAALFSDTEGGLVTANVVALIVVYAGTIAAALYGTIRLFSYSTEHWSHLTGIFVNGQTGWQILIFLTMAFALFPVKSDSK